MSETKAKTSLHTPPEWAPQSALWVGWPSDPDLWMDDFVGARREIAAMVDALAPHVAVRVAAGSVSAADAAREMLGEGADVRVVPMGDIWLRDTGPVFGQGAGGRLVGRAFNFNGWGGKYRLPGDTETAAALIAEEGANARRFDVILEGGAIDQDGAGRLLTTRQCLLNPNRNTGWTEHIAEAALRAAFDVSEIIWLGDGLRGDHTDGHVDNLARFVAPGRVVCQTPSGESDPNTDILYAVESDLRAAGLDVSTLPSPGRIADTSGDIMPASHMNFLISNGVVILPVYEDRHAPQAVAALADLFPDRKVVAIESRHLLTGGGAFHCCTQQTPVSRTAHA